MRQGTGTSVLYGTRDTDAGGGGATGLLRRLLGQPAKASEREGADDSDARSAREEESGPPPATAPEIEGPMVVAFLRLSDPEMTNDREQLRLFALEDRVMAAVYASGAGTYEGNFLDRGFLRLYASGPDADRLEKVVGYELEEAPPGSILVTRRGPPGTEEERKPLPL